MFEKLRARAAEKRRQKELAKQLAAKTEWDAERKELLELIEAAKTYDGVTRAEQPDLGIQLKKGERALAVLAPVALTEVRRGPGHYQGGYQGFSFRIAKGVRYHVGGTRGTYVPGEERPTAIDEGTVSITTQRVLFQGAKQAREWAFSKLIGVQNDPKLPWTHIQVSNRQKTSGILYGDDLAQTFRFRLALALAIYNDERDLLVADLERQLAEHDAARPVLPAEASPGSSGELLPPPS